MTPTWPDGSIWPAPRWSVNNAIEQFERAIKLDPGFAPSYAGTAEAYSWADDLWMSPAVMVEAKAAAEKAVELDDKLAEAHSALGIVLNEYDFDFAGAEAEYRRAIELNPSFA